MRSRYFVLTIVISSILLVCIAGISIVSGSLSFKALYHGLMIKDKTVLTLVVHLRLPRIVLGCAVGAALGIAGAAFQSFFHNALAEPSILGSSAGAAFGAGLALTLGLSPIAPYSFLGSLGATVAAFAIACVAANPPSASALLLAGTTVSSLFSALLSLILVIRDKNLSQVYYWLMGSLGSAVWEDVRTTVPLLAVACAGICSCARSLDLLVQGEEVAASLGVPVQKVRFIGIVSASLIVAATVSAIGIIGFVGLIAPHSARVCVGPVHSRLIPCTALFGAVLLLSSDLLARLIAPPLEIPVGIITSLSGSLFFLYLLTRYGKNIR
ncbi:iron ABC transporter permease [Pillotina sp. SPG140]